VTLGLNTILLLVALILFVVAVFSDLHQGDLIALGLACVAAAFLVQEAGVSGVRFGAGRRRSS